MFSKLLIANRGEIACRVIRTARDLGIRTVAVFSDADAAAMHVALADEAVHIGPAPAAESYLDQEAILAAAERTGAVAIHPGYGFLSENAEFAEACAARGITFVGPPPDAMRAMGAKDAAKRLMEAAHVPVVPGYHGEAQDPDLLAREAERIGYPVLIKAVAGGGGRGMRRVDDADEFQTALAAAQREAQAAFGDDRVLVERYLAKPRHIEIQIFADSHGNAVHLFERDCTIQRRHQKVIEEAPAPGMPPAMRERMGAAAVRAAKAVNYVGAGTVEFIADAEGGLSEDGFFFIEMNTRLQVEHPVTEMITGLDLVAWQLRVAAGDPLPLPQEALTIDGHALEARLYAENPAGGKFLPSTGLLRQLRLPAADAGHVRVDTGVRPGDTVSMFYDPMIAKLIVHGADRDQARYRLRSALEAVRVAGPVTNAGFLRAIADHPAFAAADLDTGFIDRHLAALLPEDGVVAEETVLAIAATGILCARRAEAARQADASGDPYSPWHSVTAWRLNGAGRETLYFAFRGAVCGIEVIHAADGMRLILPSEDEGCDIPVSGTLEGGELVAEIDGQRFNAGFDLHAGQITVMLAGDAFVIDLHDPMQAAEFEDGSAGDVSAPMPGKLVSVRVGKGDKVRKGDPLAVLEAMKMEHTLIAPADGIIATIHFAEGDQVEEGVTVIAFEDAE